MHTDEVMDKLLKEVILRKLPCNSVLELRMFLQISNKIIENLVQFPSEHKYRTLRWNNTAIHSRIISVHGGLEFLDLLGFKKIKREGVQILEINDCTDDSGRLLALKQWLRDAVAGTLRRAKARRRATSDEGRLREEEAAAAAGAPPACAPFWLQFVLPSGAVHRGAFDPDAERVGAAAAYAGALRRLAAPRGPHPRGARGGGAGDGGDEEEEATAAAAAGGGGGAEEEGGVALRRPYLTALMTAADLGLRLGASGLRADTALVVVYLERDEEAMADEPPETTPAQEASALAAAAAARARDQAAADAGDRAGWEAAHRQRVLRSEDSRARLLSQFQADRSRMKGKLLGKELGLVPAGQAEEKGAAGPLGGEEDEWLPTG